MKKMIFLVLIITVLIVPAAFAQFRIDMAIDVPKAGGFATDGDTELVSEVSDFFNEYTFPIPEAAFLYQYSFGSIPVHVGGGLRVFSLILESMAWPIIYAELDLSPFIIHTNVGGLGFMYFGILNGTTTSSLLMPDLHVAYKFGETFRLGLGAMAFTGIDGLDGVTPYAIYLTGRFSILFDK